MTTTKKLEIAKAALKLARKAFDKNPGADNWNKLERAQASYQLEWQCARTNRIEGAVLRRSYADVI